MLWQVSTQEVSRYEGIPSSAKRLLGIQLASITRVSNASSW